MKRLRQVGRIMIPLSCRGRKGGERTARREKFRLALASRHTQQPENRQKRSENEPCSCHCCFDTASRGSFNGNIQITGSGKLPPFSKNQMQVRVGRITEPKEKIYGNDNDG